MKVPKIKYNKTKNTKQEEKDNNISGSVSTSYAATKRIERAN